MTASEIKALIAGLVIVSGGAIGATLWRQHHPDASAARLYSSAPPSPILPSSSTAATPANAAPKTADLGLAPVVPRLEPAVGAGEPPHFDVVRVEPDGAAVLAGKGNPNAKVELLASGKVIAETKADQSGHFVILPADLAPGSHDLTLRQSVPGKAPSESRQSVVVSVPAKAAGPVVVALAEPGKPTQIIAAPAAPVSPAVLPNGPAQMPTAVAVAQPGAATLPAGLAIRSVELENGNGFFASGVAAPGTPVRIYLNGTRLAAVVAGADGQWTVTLKKGLTGGRYSVRAEAGQEDAQHGEHVVARVEVPFDVPLAMAQAAAPATPSSAIGMPEPPAAPSPDEVAGLEALVPAPSAPAALPTPRRVADTSKPQPGANAVIEQVETALVVPGDNLWNISRARLGLGMRFTEVYAANVSLIHDPKLIYPGQVFVVPPK